MDKEAVYHLKLGVNTIGRLSDNDVVIPDPFLSRRHPAILIHTDEKCELHDVASKNGTYVNGRKIDGPTRLNSGDEIRMCDRQYIFVRKADLQERSSPHERSNPGRLRALLNKGEPGASATGANSRGLVLQSLTLPASFLIIIIILVPYRLERLILAAVR